MVDSSFSSFRINIEPLEIIVEIDRAGAEISTKKGGMGGKDGSNIYSSFLGQR